MNILVISAIYIETQYFVKRVPLEGEFQVAGEATSSVGSKTINAARVLSKLGNKVTLYGHVGNDNEGVNAISQLDSLGLLVQVKQIVNELTGKIVVQTSLNGKSAITLFRGANETVDRASIDQLAHLIKANDALYAATNLNLDAVYELVEICAEHDKPLFLDIPNQHTDIDLEKVSDATFLAPNRQEAQLLLDTTISSLDEAFHAASELRNKVRGTILITLDEDGCVILGKNEVKPLHYAAEHLSVVDDTGAGDIFRAVFFNTWLNTKDIQHSIKKAIYIASKSTQIKGVNNTIDLLTY